MVRHDGCRRMLAVIGTPFFFMYFTQNAEPTFFRYSVFFDYRLPPSRLGKAQACLVLLSLLCRFRLF